MDKENFKELLNGRSGPARYRDKDTQVLRLDETLRAIDRYYDSFNQRTLTFKELEVAAERACCELLKQETTVEQLEEKLNTLGYFINPIPVVPQYAYDFIEECKRDKLTFKQFMESVINQKSDYERLLKGQVWGYNHLSECAQAWYAYPTIGIQKEKTYKARIKGRPLMGSRDWFCIDPIVAGIDRSLGVSREDNGHIATAKEWARLGVTSENAIFKETIHPEETDKE